MEEKKRMCSVLLLEKLWKRSEEIMQESSPKR